MIQLIKNAITKKLYDRFNDTCRVYTEFTEQGFSEPCFIVEMFPLEINADNDNLDTVMQTVRIRYVPENISQDEFISVAKASRELFLYVPLTLADGTHLRCYNVIFTIEESTLIAELTYSYTEKSREEGEGYDGMQELEIGGNL